MMPKGFKHTKETKRKMSLAKKGKTFAEIHGDNAENVSRKIGLGNKGKKCPEHQKKSNSEYTKKHVPMHNNASRLKMIASLTGRKLSEKQKINIKKALIKHRDLTDIDGRSFTPIVGKFESPTLNALEECFGYKILRQLKVLGYYVDGYCSNLKLAIEIDEPHHKYKEDVERQREIESALGCSFLRLEVPARCFKIG